MVNQDMIKNLNELLQATFQMNSFADNCAYWLDYNYFIETSEIFHQKFAHQFPEWADKISNLMIQIGIRPIRLGLVENNVNYDSHIDLFVDVDKRMLDYRKKVYDVIEIAEINECREVVSMLEEYLLIMLPYIKQTEIWMNKAQMIDNPSKFDKYFDDFTKI